LNIYAFSTSAEDNGERSTAHYYISNPGRKIPLLTEVEVLADNILWSSLSVILLAEIPRLLKLAVIGSLKLTIIPFV